MSNKKREGVGELREIIDARMDRRYFLKCTAFLGGSLAATHYLARFAVAAGADWSTLDLPIGDAYVHHLPVNQIYSVCQQCNTNCGIKVKVVDGRIEKIDGSPFNPWTLSPHLASKTSMSDAARLEGAICPKGQAGIQTLYDPYRIVKVLKRAGKRGENKWKSIPFDQAVAEIVDGGNLFGEGPIEGLMDICVLRDPEIGKNLAVVGWRKNGGEFDCEAEVHVLVIICGED